MNISEVTRRNIIDILRVEKINWSGRLSEVDFLNRLFDLSRMRSFDHRFSDAAGDISQHRIMNYDWENDWVYEDPRFNLLRCEDEILLAFLCEMIHPVVRDNEQEVNQLLEIFNGNLRNDGWQIIEVTRISNRPVFSARPLLETHEDQLQNALEVVDGLNSEYISRQITRMQNALRNNDCELAIGTSKEFLETVCKRILREREIEFDEIADLPRLISLVQTALQLSPRNVPNAAIASRMIRELYQALATVVNKIAEIRNEYGTGHGRDGFTDGLDIKYAKLAVGAASSLGVFLFEIHNTEEN
jgi:hypothetical protein